MGRKPILTVAGVALAVTLAGCQQTAPQRSSGTVQNSNTIQNPGPKSANIGNPATPAGGQAGSAVNNYNNYNNYAKPTPPVGGPSASQFPPSGQPSAAAAGGVNTNAGPNNAYMTANPSPNSFQPTGATKTPGTLVQQPGMMLPPDPPTANSNFGPPQIAPPVNPITSNNMNRPAAPSNPLGNSGLSNTAAPGNALGSNGPSFPATPPSVGGYNSPGSFAPPPSPPTTMPGMPNS